MDEDSFWDNQDSSSGTVDNTSSDDFWGNQDSSSSSSDDFWNSATESSSQSADDYWANQEQYSNTQEEPTEQAQKVPIETKFGYKTVALIAVGALLVLALLLAFINGIKVSKKTNTTSVANTGTTNTVTSSSAVNFTSIPDSMSLDYSGQVYDGTGTVTAKNRYLTNNQVIYDLVIDMGSQRVDFYCNYDVYKVVSTGDTLRVSYQIPQSGYITVTQVNYE